MNNGDLAEGTAVI